MPDGNVNQDGDGNVQRAMAAACMCVCVCAQTRKRVHLRGAGPESQAQKVEPLAPGSSKLKRFNFTPSQRPLSLTHCTAGLFSS